MVHPGGVRERRHCSPWRLHYDAYGLRVLDQEECRKLLEENSVGRFVFVDRMVLAVHPVAYVFDRGSVVFQTNGGAKLDAATKHDLAAFEVDYIDPDLGWGWTVTLSGHAEPVTDPYEVARLHKRLPEPWTNSGRVDIIRMHGEIIQGRRKMPEQVDPAHLMADTSDQAIHRGSPSRHQVEGEGAKTQ